MRQIKFLLIALFALMASSAAHAGAPIATTRAATNVTGSSATLNGTVNANNGFDATVSFDYGLTAGYGTRVGATTGAIVRVFDNDRATSVVVTGLTCDTTYHFRVSATSTSGTTDGADLTFTTTKACPVAGVCGAAQGMGFTSPPTTELCTTGAASAVTSANASYGWTCGGENGGASPSCAATRNYPVATSVGAGFGTIGPAREVPYGTAVEIRLTPAIRYRAGSVEGTCGGTLAANRFITLPVTSACSVVARYVPDTVRNALFVNASTSANKTSLIRISNPLAQSGLLSATAYSEQGAVLGTPNTPLGTLLPQQTVSWTSAELEAVLGFTPSAPTAKYRVVFDSALPGLELVNFVQDIASGDLTLGQSQVDTRIFVDSSPLHRNALFLNASSSPNKTSVVRIINTSGQSGMVMALAYGENGEMVGRGGVEIASIGPQQMLTFTSGDLEALLGFTPVSPTSKYRVMFTSGVPGLEIINVVRDNATGRLTLGQSQIDSRPFQATGPSVRHALTIEPSSNTNRSSVVRVINLSEDAAQLTATAYDETGTVVGAADAPLGVLGQQQMLTFTSTDLESLIGYPVPNASDRYRIAFKSNLRSFEVINFFKDTRTGNLTLAQAQIDNRVAEPVATSSTRGVLVTTPSSFLAKSTQIRVVNLTDQVGTLTATAFDEGGAQVGTPNASLGTLRARGARTLSAAQLEAALGYQPPSPQTRYRLVITSTLPTFEVVNYIVDTATGGFTLGQEQID